MKRKQTKTIATAEKESDNRAQAAINYCRAKIKRCCGPQTGKQWCESYGCGTLQEIIDILTGKEPEKGKR